MADTTTNPQLLPRIKVLHPASASDENTINLPRAEQPLSVPLFADLALSLMLDQGAIFGQYWLDFRFGKAAWMPNMENRRWRRRGNTEHLVLVVVAQALQSKERVVQEVIPVPLVTTPAIAKRC